MNTKYILGVLLMTAFMWSCEDFLEENPPTFISTTNFWKTQSDARTGTDAIYKALFDGSSNSIYGRWWPPLDSGTDDVTSRIGRSNFNDWYSHTVNANHPWLESWSQYQNFWKGISRANDVLAFVPGIDVDENEKNEILAEARAMRALNYYHLVKTWGDMPLVINSVETPDDFNLPRSSVNRVYDEIIIPDLKFAEVNGKDAVHTGRVTKWTAKVILADVYLTYAGWRRTSQGDIIQGDAANWSLARDAAKDIIDNSPHSLMTDAHVNGAHTTPACGMPWLESEPYSKESMFELGAVNISGFGSYLSRECSPHPHGHRYWGASAGSQPLSDEGNTGKINGDLRFPGYPATVGLNIPTPDLYAHFEDGDERRDWNLMTRYDTAEGETYLCQPTFRKYVDINYFLGKENTSFLNTNNNSILYRYADALLIYAEAQNEADGAPNTDAYNAINEIRNRAGLADLTLGLNQEDFRLAVYKERRSEFVGEVKRRFDLIRTNRVVLETTDINLEWTSAEGALSDYVNANGLHGTAVWPDREWLMPIPQTDLNLNEKNGWVQNEGYSN